MMPSAETHTSPTFVIPLTPFQPLIKAQAKMKPLASNLGTWQGLKVIAIGPKGGKIVGYRSDGKPIYAGSKAAESLAKTKKAKANKESWTPALQDKTLVQWLFDLGLKGSITPTSIKVSEATGKMLSESFGVPFQSIGGGYVTLDKEKLLEFVGEPLKPSPEEEMVWAAKVAAGVDQDPGMPDLENLTEIPAGKFAGSHGNRVFKDEHGKVWIFKGADPTIARAEEAASRIGRLIMGDKIPRAEYLQVDGKDGVLIEFLEGKELTTSDHSTPSATMLKKHAKDVVWHQVVDWLIANHDAHAGNFLADGEVLNGIDKGQAWKWVGKDVLDGKFHGDNPSLPIYDMFWKGVFPQLSTAEQVKALVEMGKAIDAVEKITPKQFETIIKPYVATSTGWTGKSPANLIKKMVDRLKSMRDDFQAFLQKKGLSLPPSESKDNFETMPEVEPEKKPVKAVIHEPVKPPTLEEEAKPIPPGEPVPGWPIKKGTGKGWVEVMAPGDPSPGGKWKKGIPGPGYSCRVFYKGQLYSLEIKGPDKKGKPIFSVLFPNGTFQEFDSPNAAGDALYLYHNNLDINMTGTEKKAKGISLGTKVFKFKDFEKELAAAHSGGEVDPIQMTPEELEYNNFVPEKAPKLSQWDLLSKEPDGTVTDWSKLPPEIEEFLNENSPTIGTDYPVNIAPGIPVKVKSAQNGKAVIIAAQIGPSGTPTYSMWSEHDGVVKPVHGIDAKALDDGGWVFEDLPGVQAHKKLVTKEEPKTVEEQVATAPAAELPKEAKVPENSKETDKGPLPPGSSVEVKKKGIGQVLLTVKEKLDGSLSYEVMLGTSPGVHAFDSLSAASDFVWVNQKGYNDADEYKEKNNTNKVPSGGGWKFWGINPKKQAPPKPAPAESPKKTEGWGQLFPGPWGPEFVTMLPVGVEIKIGTGINAQFFVKKEDDGWKQVGYDGKYTDAQIQKKTGGGGQVKMPEPVEVPPGPSPNQVVSLEFLEAAKPGTQVHFKGQLSDVVLMKQANGLWASSEDESTFVSKNLWESVEKGTATLTVVPVEESPGAPNWETMPDGPTHVLPDDVYPSYFKQAPVGAWAIATIDGKKEIFRKGLAGKWVNTSGSAPIPDNEMAVKLSGATGTIEFQKGQAISPFTEDIWSKWDEGMMTLDAIPGDASFFDAAPVGSKFMAMDKYGNQYLYRKLKNGKWENAESKDVISSETILQAFSDAITMSVQPEPKVEVLKEVPSITSEAEAAALPVGTKVLRDGIELTKTEPNKWMTPDKASFTDEQLLWGDSVTLVSKPTKFEENWETMPESPTAVDTANAKAGDQYKMTDSDGDFWMFRKVTNDLWAAMNEDGTYAGPEFTDYQVWKVLHDADNIVKYEKTEGAPGDTEKFVSPTIAHVIPPPQAELDAYPAGTTLAWDWEEYGESILWKKNADGTWNKFRNGKLDLEGKPSFVVTDEYPDDTVALVIPESAKEKSKANLPGTMHFSKETLPENMHKFFDQMMEQLGPWLEKKEGSPHAAAEKPGDWPEWAPPPGVLFQGEFDGKKFFMCTANSGYSEDGETDGVWNCAIFDEEGTVHIGGTVEGTSAIKSLKNAASKAGINLEFAAALKKVFGLDKAKFAPGETFDTLKNGTGPSALPEKSADPNKIVKVTLTAKQAIENHLKLQVGKLNIKPAKEKAGKPGAHYICLDGVDNAAEVLNEALVELGLDQHMLTKGKYPKTNSKGAFTAIYNEILNNNITVEMPAYQAEKLQKPVSDDNWETMPDALPKVLDPGSFSLNYKLEKLLIDAPQGTMFAGSDDKIYVKSSDHGFDILASPKEGDYYKKTLSSTEVTQEMKADKDSLKVFPPGTSLEELNQNVKHVLEAQKKAKAAAKKKADAKKQELEAAKAEAKKLAEWAKDHPSVSNDAELFVLAHFQNHFDLHGVPKGCYAKVDGADILLAHKDEPEKFQKLLEDLKLDGEWVDTPLGKMFRTTISEIQKSLPGDPAGLIKGPDGKMYPAGTKFEEKTIEYTAKDLLGSQPGFYKAKDHKDNPDWVVLKVSGTGEKQVQQMKDIVKNLDLEGPFPEPKPGGSNVVHFVTKKSLEKVVKTETKLEVTKPNPPPAFVQTSLPGLSGGTEVWSEVESKPEELGMLPAMKLPMFGHAIMMGKPGVLRDFQVIVRKVKGEDGKFYHEVSGQLANFKANKVQGLDSSYVGLPSALSKPVEGSKTVDYDEDEAFTDESKAGGNIMSESGYKGATDNGTKVEVLNGSATFKGTFKVRIPEGQDIEAELATAFTMLGEDPKKATGKMTEADMRVYKKFSIVRALMGPKGWNKALTSPASMHKEKWLDAQLKELGGEHLVEGATIRQTFEGTISVVLDDGDVFKKAGWKFAMREDSGLDSLFFQILQGKGWASRKLKYLMGSGTAGWSGASDVETGGATGNFFRVAKDSASTVANDWGIIMHPRVFQRADWWRFNGDNYGSIVGAGPGSLSNGVKRYDASGVYGSNEIMFQGGCALEDVIGITTPSESSKQELIAKLKKHGVTEINGVELEKVIFVAHSSDIDTVIKQIPEELRPNYED